MSGPGVLQESTEAVAAVLEVQTEQYLEGVKWNQEVQV